MSIISFMSESVPLNRSCLKSKDHICLIYHLFLSLLQINTYRVLEKSQKSVPTVKKHFSYVQSRKQMNFKRN